MSKINIDTYKDNYLEELAVIDGVPVTSVRLKTDESVIGEIIGPRRVNGKATPREIVSFAGDIPYELGTSLDDEEAMDLIIRGWEVSQTEG